MLIIKRLKWYSKEVGKYELKKKKKVINGDMMVGMRTEEVLGPEAIYMVSLKLVL